MQNTFFILTNTSDAVDINRNIFLAVNFGTEVLSQGKEHYNSVSILAQNEHLMNLEHRQYSVSFISFTYTIDKQFFIVTLKFQNHRTAMKQVTLSIFHALKILKLS